MTADKARTSVEFQVPFHDVDVTRMVWHGHYFKYLELARTEYLRRRKLDVLDIYGMGYRMVVIESRCRHTFPLSYGDQVRVDAFLRDVDVRLNFGFEIHNMTAGRRAAKGTTVLATLDDGGELLYGTPAAILERLACP